MTNFPLGKKAIDTKWVYKLKCKANGSIDHYEERLYAKGYAQEKEIEYAETFAPTFCMIMICSVCALAEHHG